MQMRICNSNLMEAVAKGASSSRKYPAKAFLVNQVIWRKPLIYLAPQDGIELPTK